MSRICIDGLQLALPYDNGIGTYSRNLNDALVAIGHSTGILYGRNVRNSPDAPLREALFFTETAPEITSLPRRVLRTFRAIPAALTGGSGPFEIPRTGLVVRDDRFNAGATLYNSRHLYHAAFLRFRLTGTMLTIRNPGGVEICHWTSPLPVRMRGAKNIYTLHDLIPVRYPYLAGGSPSLFYRVARAAASVASHIVTVSEHSRRELLQYLALREDQVTNTYQSVVISPPATDRDGTLLLYGLADRDYYLSFSVTDPRKNIVRMIEAHLASGTRRKLVIAGQFGWLGTADIRLLSNMGLWNANARQPQSGGKVAFLGHVSREHLDQLIRGARAVLFPSITEGFGLPIVEAMGRGIAVLTSRGGATEEIAGGAALLIDPLNVASIAAGIRELDTNTDLVTQLEQQGPGRAAQFNADAYRNRLQSICA